MTTVLGRMADWLPGGVRAAATRAGTEFVFGSIDERALNRIAKSAVFRTAKQLLPGASPEEVEGLAAVLDEVFTPHTLLLPESTSPAVSISASFLEGLTKQLQRLYEPLDPTGFSTATEMKLSMPPVTVAEVLMAELCTLIAFEAPSNATTLHSLRQDHSVARALPVREGADDKALSVRYLVCRSFDVIADIIDDRFDRLPVKSPILLTNEVSEFWKLLVARHGGRMRWDEVRGGTYTTSVDYRRSFPDARIANPEQHLPAYDLVRECTEKDIRERVAASDPVSLMLLESGVKPADVCQVVGHHRLCGPDGPETFLEEYLVRPIWGLLAEFVVNDNTPFALDSWHAYVQDDGIHCLAAATDSQQSHSISRLPRVPIEPGQSIVVPLATLVPRFPIPPERYVFLDSDRDQDGRFQELKISMFRGSELSVDLWGPARIPSKVTVALAGKNRLFDVREFEPSLMYTIDRSWYSGSCPHVFELHGKGRATYHGTAFSAAPETEQVFRLQIDPGATHLMIAELESELTFIRELLVDGETRLKGEWVTSGRSLIVKLEPGDQSVEMRGLYILPPGPTRTTSSSGRNSVVRDFMRKLDAGPLSAGC